MSEKDIRSDYLSAYDQAWAGWQGYVAEAENDLNFFLNDQLSEDEKRWLNREDRYGYQFNKVARFVRLLSGFEIKDRHVLKIGPIGNEDDHAASQHTGIIMTQMNSYDGYDVLSDAFKWGSLITGANLVEIYLDRRDGQVRFGRLGYNEFLLDPAFSKRDLSDCQFILRGKWLDPEYVKQLIPGKEKAIDDIPDIGGPIRWNRLPNRDKLYGRQMRLYEEFYYRASRKEKMIIIRDQNGRPLNMIPMAKFDAAARQDGHNPGQLLAENPMFDQFTDYVPTVKLAVLVDGEVMYDGDNPTKMDDFNHVFVGGEFCPECDDDTKKIQGMVRVAKDPQKAMNRRINQILDIVETQLHALRVYREGSLVNEADAYKSGQGITLAVRKEFNGGVQDAFHQENAPDIPAGMFNLFTLLDRNETEIVGLNTEIFGTEQKEVAGILAQLRTGNALTGQQGMMNGYRQAKRCLGRKLVRINQLTLSPQDVMRYVQEQPAQGFYDKDFVRFDCVPCEGVQSDTQRQMWYQELLALKQYPDFAAKITLDMVLDAAPIQLKHKMRENIRKQEKQEAMIQQKALQAEQRRADLENAVTQSKIAQAQADITQSRENLGNLALDRARTMAEIQKIQSEPGQALLDSAIKLEQIKAKPKSNPGELKK